MPKFSLYAGSQFHSCLMTMTADFKRPVQMRASKGSIHNVFNSYERCNQSKCWRFRSHLWILSLGVSLFLTLFFASKNSLCCCNNTTCRNSVERLQFLCHFDIFLIFHWCSFYVNLIKSSKWSLYLNFLLTTVDFKQLVCIYPDHIFFMSNRAGRYLKMYNFLFFKCWW